MATAIRPGADEDDKRRQLLEASLSFVYDDKNLTMTIGDVNGIAERDCMAAGGLPPLACVSYVVEVSAGNMASLSLSVIASLVFYAMRQTGDDATTFTQLMADIDYTKAFEITSAMPDLPDLGGGPADPTNGA
jgi:hypothetical protein